MSTDAEADRKRPVPAWRRLLVVAGWFVLFMVLISGGVYLVNRGRLMSQLDRVVKELDENDPGWRWDGILASRREVRAEENSVPRILAIVRSIPRGWPDHRKAEKFQDLAPNLALDGPRKKILDEVMATPPVPALRPQARDLVRFPRGRLELVVPENPYAILLPDHQKMREAASLLSLDAHDLALNRKPDDALVSTRACLNVSRAMEDDPTIIGQLIRIATTAIAMGMAERTMALGEPSDVALAALQEELKHEAGRNGMLIAMRGERATTHQALTLMAAGKLSVREIVGGGGDWWGLGWFSSFASGELARREHADLLRLLTRMVEATKLPGVDQIAVEEDIEKQVKSPKVGMMTRLLLPAVAKIGQSARRVQSQAAAMRALIAVERYRQKHGKWPGKLEDVVPAFLDKVPLDPIDGKPIRYGRWADGVVVYSIGNDLKDDGGDVARPFKDFGHRLWDPAKRRAAPPPLPAEVPDAPPGGPMGPP